MLSENQFCTRTEQREGMSKKGCSQAPAGLSRLILLLAARRVFRR
jgi:hypothetical protein